MIACNIAAASSENTVAAACVPAARPVFQMLEKRAGL